MTINKYQGKTKEEAVEKAKQELGAGAVVLNVKEIKPKGMFKMFKNTLYEVTAAVEEKEVFPAQTLRSETKPVHDTISLAADEKITSPGVARENARPAAAVAPVEQEVVPMKEAKRENIILISDWYRFQTFSIVFMFSSGVRTCSFENFSVQ